MLLQNMDLNLLLYLDVLLDEQSVVKAAKRLNLTQPALSNALKRLRESLKDELLIHAGRTMTRTRFAELIRPSLKRSLQFLQDEVLGRKKFDPEVDTFEFITAFHGYEERILLPALAKAFAKFPNIAVFNRLPKSLDSGEELANGTLHFTTTPITSDRAGIMRCRLFTDRYVCLVHEKAGLSHVDLDMFCKLPHLLIAPHGGTGPVDQALRILGRSRCIKTAVGEFNSAPFVLDTNHALITTVPERLAKLWCEHFRFRIINCPVELEPLSIYLSWHGSMQNSPQMAWFKELLELLAMNEGTRTELKQDFNLVGTFIGRNDANPKSHM